MRALKSTVRRALPLFLAITTILEHHLTGSLTPTLRKTPVRTSRSNPALTDSARCAGTFPGRWTATGVAPGSTCSRSAGADFISGNCCLVQVLKALALYLSTRYFRRRGTFSGVPGNGIVSGGSGAVALAGHLHVLSPSGVSDACCCRTSAGGTWVEHGVSTGTTLELHIPVPLLGVPRFLDPRGPVRDCDAGSMLPAGPQL